MVVEAVMVDAEGSGTVHIIVSIILLSVVRETKGPVKSVPVLAIGPLSA